MKVNFTETVLRDANQSLIATRMPFSDFEPILSTMDKAGYYSLECWGGATFDSCLRYLNEDPWERLRKIRAACPNTKLQMLLRGQNLLGYKHYPDDVVRLFVKKSVENGIDIIRIFDALNDVRNIEVAVDETLKNGAIASGTICYTLSPIHNLESYVKLAKQIESLGVGSICVKDMAGIMSPKEGYDLVKALKETVKVPVVVHTHSTTGLGFMTLLKCVEAGADVIDTAISSFSGGTSQPATETLVYALRQLGYEVGVDEKVCKEINDFFKPIRDKALKSGLLNPVVMGTQTDALIYQIPGGMLSNLVAQLTAQKKLDKLDEVLEEPTSSQARDTKISPRKSRAISRANTARLPAKSAPSSRSSSSATRSPTPADLPILLSRALRLRELISAAERPAMRTCSPILRSPLRQRLSLTRGTLRKRTPSPIP